MVAQDYAGKSVAEIAQDFISGKVAARDILEGVLARCTRAEPFNPIAILDADGCLLYTSDAADE